MNKVILIGRLTKDPELKFAAGSGNAVTTFTLAVDRKYANKEGQREADFIPIVCFGKTAEYAANYFTKGKLIAVSGSIQVRKYTAQDGSTRYATDVAADEVQNLQFNKEGGPSGRPDEFKPSNGGGSEMGFMPVDEDEDIPF